MPTYVIYGAFLVAGLIIGFVPLWIVSRRDARRSAERLAEAEARPESNPSPAPMQSMRAVSEAEHRLTLAALQNALASAVIDAHRGSYEAARFSASGFFTSLAAEASKGDDSSLSQSQRDAVQPLLARRDDIIALLARNDPASTERLADLYVSFREIVNIKAPEATQELKATA